MEFDFKLNEQDFNIIMQALGELPLKMSVNTFAKLQAQMQAHQAVQVKEVVE